VPDETPYVSPIDRMRWLQRVNGLLKDHPLATECRAHLELAAMPGDPPPGLVAHVLFDLLPDMRIGHEIPVPGIDLLVQRSADLEDRQVMMMLDPLVARGMVACAYGMLERLVLDMRSTMPKQGGLVTAAPGLNREDRRKLEREMKKGGGS